MALLCLSFSRRILFASVKALALRKMDQKGKDVLVKQPIGAAQMPVRAINGESSARTERWGNKAQLRYKFSR